MGLLTYEQPLVADDFIIGFDTRFAYKYLAGWIRISTEASPGAASWIGDNTQFFWATTWRGAQAYQKIFFVTNNNPNEKMRFFDGTTWDYFFPSILSGGGTFLITAQILVVFKNRLLALNTYEGTAPGAGNLFSNRCRYSKIGSPLDADAWYQDVPGKGNAIDAPTSEAIVTALFVKDRLIVYFEKSTWELVYLGNQAFPFGWQKINTDLGAESSFTIIALESQAIGIGNVGIHACNGSVVNRIDQKIPDLVFDIHEVNGGIQRVYGIRDFQNEMLYWSYVAQDGTTQQPYPDKVLAYNYRNDTWAINDDSITAFGYFLPITGVLWNSETVTWSDPVLWSSGLQQAAQRVIVAGNQEGYTFICDADIASNASVLQITNLTTVSSGVFNLNIIDHNLRDKDYIYINSCVFSDASTPFNGNIYQINAIFDGSGNVDPNNVQFVTGEPIRPPLIVLTGTYVGGGTVATVSLISIKTKEYNFYAQEGKKASVTKAEFLVDTTDTGAIQVDFYVSTNQSPFLMASGITGTLIGTGTLDTYPYTTTNSASIGDLEADSERIWHPVYFQAMGNAIQLQFTMNYAQMINPNISYYPDFQLHALCFTAKKLGDRLE